jgi:hypothetical protein
LVSVGEPSKNLARCENCGSMLHIQLEDRGPR